jgi:hypothetical protein
MALNRLGERSPLLIPVEDLAGLLDEIVENPLLTIAVEAWRAHGRCSPKSYVELLFTQTISGNGGCRLPRENKRRLCRLATVRPRTMPSRIPSVFLLINQSVLRSSEKLMGMTIALTAFELLFDVVPIRFPCVQPFLGNDLSLPFALETLGSMAHLGSCEVGNR